MVIEENHLEVEVGMERIRIIEEDCSILTVIEMTLGEEIVEKHKIIEVRIIEVDVETIIEMTTKKTIVTTIEMTIMEEVGADLKKDDTQVTLKGIIEKAEVVDLDQV